MNKKKIAIFFIIVVLLITMFVLLSKFNVIGKLKGEALITNEVTKEQEEDVCNISEESDSYIIIDLEISHDYGDKSPAQLTFASDNNTYKKEVEISQEESHYKYVLPKADYILTVEKEGYDSYQINVNKNKELKIILHNKSIGNVVTQNKIGDNLYYTYYENGLLLINGYGNMWNGFDLEKGDFNFEIYTGNLLNDVVHNKLKENGVELSYDEKSFLFSIRGLMSGAVIGYCNELDIDEPFRDIYMKAKEQLDEDVCSDSNINMCGDIANVFIYNLGYEKAKKVVDIVLSLPVNTNTIITDKITSFEPYVFTFSTINNFNLTKNMEDYYEKNLEAFASIGSPLAFSKINNISFDFGIKKIPQTFFATVNLENANVILPNSIVEIENDAFYATRLSNIYIPNSVLKIGEGAFSNNNLTSVTIPSSVTEIEDRAFGDNPFEIITILGDKTRFNSDWQRIGFPSDLMPSE